MDREQQQQLRDKLGELLEEKGDKIEEMNATELQQIVIDCYKEVVKVTVAPKKKAVPSEEQGRPNKGSLR